MPLERWKVLVDEGDGNGWHTYILCGCSEYSLMRYNQDFHSRGYIDHRTVRRRIFHRTHLVSQGEVCTWGHFTCSL